MKNQLSKITVLLLFLFAFSCNKTEGIEPEYDYVAKLKNSDFYEFLSSQGFSINENKHEIKTSEKDHLMRISAVNTAQRNGRTYEHYEIFVKFDSLNQLVGGGVVSFETIPDSTYTGMVNLDYLNLSEHYANFYFESGELKLYEIIEPNSKGRIDVCNSTRKVAECAGSRIENYNTVEYIEFTVGFPATLLWEMASCVNDGCPIEWREIKN